MTLNGQEIGAGENQPHFRTRAPGPQIFIIPHRQQFVKRKVAQKLNNYFSRICALLPIDFWYGLWYTIGVKGRGKGNLNHASGNALDARPRELAGE